MNKSVRIIEVKYLEDGSTQERHEMEDGSVFVFGYYNGNKEYEYKVKLTGGNK